MTFPFRPASALLALILAACATTAAPRDPAAQFFARVSALCGQAFAGRVVSNEAADAEMAAERLIMHVRECGQGELRIPFHVGANASRTWVVTRTATGLRLKHDHRHEDGSPDRVTMYGGDTAAPGAAGRQEFPVDAFSRELFIREGLEVSTTNVWGMEIAPGEVFAYELRRPGRYLSRPVAPPPPPWGAEMTALIDGEGEDG